MGLSQLAAVILVLPGLRRRGLSGRAAGWALGPTILLALVLAWAFPSPLFPTPRPATILAFIAVQLLGPGLLAHTSWRSLPREPVSGRVQGRDRAVALLFPLIVMMPINTALGRLGN